MSDAFLWICVESIDIIFFSSSSAFSSLDSVHFFTQYSALRNSVLSITFRLSFMLWISFESCIIRGRYSARSHIVLAVAFHVIAYIINAVE